MTGTKGSVALVTGASRGIGKALVQALYERGAAKVYATARAPKAIAHLDAVPLALEVTDQQSVAAAAAAAPDVTVLIHNAGVLVGGFFPDSQRGIGVTGLHAGYVDTDMTAGLEGPKISPHRVAQLALDGIQADAPEVLAEDLTGQAKAALSAGITALYPARRRRLGHARAAQASAAPPTRSPSAQARPIGPRRRWTCP